MAYLRGEWYIWSDGYKTHVWRFTTDRVYDDYRNDCGYAAGVDIPNDVFDALALMRVAQIDAGHNRRKYEKKALKYAGNFGSAALCERLGMTQRESNG